MRNRIPVVVAVLLLLLAGALSWYGGRAHWFDGLHEALHPDPAKIERQAYRLQAVRDRDAALGRGDAKEAARQEDLIKEYTDPK